MNCRRFQQQVSSYLDHQMTGEEMLAMQRHRQECAACDEELRALRELKLLLRALPAQRPSRAQEQRLVERILQEPAAGLLLWPRRMGQLSLMWPRPQRGRRLAAAFALSCMGLFTVAAPFAPPFADIATVRPAPPSRVGRLDARALSVAAPRLEAASWAAPLRSLMMENSLFVPAALETRRPDRVPAPDAQPLLAGAGDEPLGDEAVSGYARGDAVLADYRTP